MSIPEASSVVTHVIETPGPKGVHLSTINYGWSTDPSLDQVTALHLAFLNLWGGIGSEETTLKRTIMRGDTLGFEYDQDQVGGNAGAIPSPQIALLVRKSTGLLGKENRGRMYFPCVLLEADIDDSGNCTGTGFTSLKGDIEDWYTGLGTNPDLTGGMVIQHAAGTTPTPVTSITVESVVATQRRRLKR